jgi:hypothetical protein
MSQVLYKIQQLSAYTHTAGLKSRFTDALDECVRLAFTSLIGGQLSDTTDAFIKRIMPQVGALLDTAYIEYHGANTRDLLYAEYAKFMSAVHSCGFFLQNARLRTLKQETLEEHTHHGTPQPLPPTPQLPPTLQLPQPQPTQQAEARGNGNTVRALLAKVRALLDELEKASEV